MFGEKNHRYIYIFGLILLVVSLPLSKFTLSVSQFIIAGNWLVEGKFREKYQEIIKNKALLLFEILFFLHIIGLVYTSNFNYAILSLKLKLPLLLIPIFITTSSPLSKTEFKLIVRFFIAGVFASSLIGTLAYYNIIPIKISSSREISLFIHHISLAILVNIAFFFALNLAKDDKKIIKLAQAGIAFWFLLFLFILKSITGIAILILGFYFILLKQSIKLKKHAVFLTSLLIIVPIILAVFSISVIKNYYNTEPPEKQSLPIQTINGNVYYHNTKSQLRENGNFVYINISEKELRNEWNKISTFNYDGKDLAGNDLKHTLIRYLTSKNLKKDSVGIHQLTKSDISAIEKGYSNYLYTKKFGISSKVADVLWQISLYKDNGQFQWNSVIQRFKAYKIGTKVFCHSWLIGYGTGDIEDAFIKEYENTTGHFEKHAFSIGVNQFLTFLVSFGILGTLILCFALFYPPYMLRMYNDYYFYIFLIISIIAMFSEEMLKFQTGTTIFAFFYTILLFGRKYSINEKHG